MYNLYIISAIRTGVRVVFINGLFLGCLYREAGYWCHDIPPAPTLNSANPATASYFSISNSIIFSIKVEQKHCFTFYVLKNAIF